MAKAKLRVKIIIMNVDLLKLVEGLHRERKIESEVILKNIEQAISVAISNHLKKATGVKVSIDRQSGKITAEDENGLIDSSLWSRIAAQAAKKALSMKLRGAEAEAAYAVFINRIYSLVSGTVARYEGRDAIVMVEQNEAILEDREQIPGESYRVGSIIKAILLAVRKQEDGVKIILSRAHPDFVKKLFEMEVPELADKAKSVEVKGLVREAGFRTKIAVFSDNPKIDAVGACVGVRGARIKNVVEEIGDEKIDVIKWSEQPELFIAASMKPAEVQAIEIDTENRRAKVFVSPDQIALAIGKKGQNIRLASKLTKWEIDVLSSDQMPSEETK